MPGPMMGGMNPMLALLSPDQQQSYMQLQQQQALGQAMLQQGMQPVDMGQNPVGGMAYHVSPLNGINKVLQTYLGNKMAMNSMGQQAQLMGQMYGNAFGQDQQAPVAQSAPPVAASGDSGGLTGPTAGMGGMQGTPSPQALGATLQQNGVATPTQTVTTPGTFSLPGYTAAQSRQLYMMNPEEYAKARMAFVTPTDATRMAIAAHMDPVAANAAAQFKANYVPPNQGTPGTIARSPYDNKPMYYSPNVPANGQPVFNATGQLAGVGELPGANALIGGQKAAETAGEGSQLPFTSGVDAQGNPLPVMSRTQAATGNTPGAAVIPQIESRGNPNAISPKGAIGAWQVMPNTNANPGFGVKPAQNNSPAELNRVGQDYYSAMTQRYSDPALAAVAYNMGPGATDKWLASGGDFSKLPQETQLYLGRWTAANAVNSRASSQPGGGAIYAAPPMGAQANAEAQAKAQIDTMQKSYQGIMPSRAGGSAAIQDIDNMVGFASGKPGIIAGHYATQAAGLMSADAALYEKSRDNLVTNLGTQLGIGSDAARDMVYGSVPAYGAPRAAITEGLATLKGQVQMRMQKADFMSGAYAKQDAVAYNQRDNAFDQNMTPALAGITSMPAGPQRAAALKQASGDPQMRARLEWAAQNGVLK